MKTSNPLKRNKYIPPFKKPISVMPMIPGGTLKDVLAGVNATTSISGTRYGIVNGVVTQFAANKPPIEDYGLRGCPAFTQLCNQSETLTDAAWGKGNFLTPTIYETFQGQNIWNLTENTVINVVHQLNQVIFSGISDNSVIGCSIIAKYHGRKAYFVVAAKDGTYKTCRMNLQAGVVETSSGAAASITPLGDGYYRLFFAANVLAGASTVGFNIQPHNGTSNQYTGDGVSGIYIGQPTYINFGVNGVPFIPPYLPNNTNGSISVVSEAATATTGMSFDLDDAKLARLKTSLRGPSAQGHLELEFVSNVDSSWLPNGADFYANIFSCENLNVRGLLFRKSSVDNSLVWRLTDVSGSPQTITVGVSSVSVGQLFKLFLDYGTHSTGQKMRITVNGVKSALANFSGSFGGQDLRFFFANTSHAGWIVKDSLKISEKPQW